MINIFDRYNVNGNGKDDSGDLQAAIDDAPAGSTLYFPATEVNEYLCYNSLLLTKSMNFKFDKGAKIINQTGGALFRCFPAQEGSTFSFEKMSVISGSISIHVSSSVSALGDEGCLVRDCLFENTDQAVYQQAPESRLRFQNSIVKDGGDGIKIESDGNFDLFEVSDSSFLNLSGTGVRFDKSNSDGSGSVYIRNTHFQGNAGGIILNNVSASSQNVTFSSNSSNVVSTGSAALTSEGFLGRELVHYYVAPTHASASDSNSGDSADNPLATLDQVVRILNQNTITSNSFLVHLESGSYSMTENLQPRLMQAPILFYGDGAGQAGDDGFFVLHTGTVVAGTTQSSLITSGTFTPQEYVGKTLEIVDGVAAGDRVSIAANTDVEILPSDAWFDAPAEGDSYRILEPGVVIEFPSAPVNATLNDRDTFTEIRSVGVGVGGMRGFLSVLPIVGSREMLTFANIKFQSDGAETVAYWHIIDSCLNFYGCEVDVSNGLFHAPANKTTTWLCGMDGIILGIGSPTNHAAAYNPRDLGVASRIHSWAGWGLHAPGGFTFRGGKIQGTVCGGGPWLIQNSELFFYGGGVSNSDGPALSFLQGCVGEVNGSFGIPYQIDASGSLAVDAGVYVAASAINLNKISITKGGPGAAIIAEGDGSGQGANPAFISLQDVDIFTGSTVPGHVYVVVGGSQIGFDHGSTSATGFASGTQCAVYAGGAGEVLIDQKDLISFAHSGSFGDGGNGWFRTMT